MFQVDLLCCITSKKTAAMQQYVKSKPRESSSELKVDVQSHLVNAI